MGSRCAHQRAHPCVCGSTQQTTIAGPSTARTQIKASRIKFYDDPFFKDMLARQEGKPFPYPPSVQGVGPWGGESADEASQNEPRKPAERTPVRDRSQRREARAMSVMAMEAGRGQLEPETLERAAAVPKEWEAVLDAREDFIEELLGG